MTNPRSTTRRRLAATASAALVAATTLVATTALQVVSAPPAAALDNHLGRTPQMGWNSWNKFRCAVTATDIKGAADAIVANTTGGGAASAAPLRAPLDPVIAMTLPLPDDPSAISWPATALPVSRSAMTCTPGRSRSKSGSPGSRDCEVSGSAELSATTAGSDRHSRSAAHLRHGRRNATVDLAIAGQRSSTSPAVRRPAPGRTLAPVSVARPGAGGLACGYG
ncbi:hypothetical protein GCM10010495_80290 [Kitasatospora herbaricolor]|nr:hypothetical protein GCM10010495_80290 [Kitasatospora herbaricolor]